MTGKNMKKDFKGAAKGIMSDLLKDTPTPDSLNDTTAPDLVDAQIQKTTSMRSPKPTQESDKPESKVRLHCLISQDLDDLIEERVRKMRKDRSIPKKQATRTAVVEAALKAFL